MICVNEQNFYEHLEHLKSCTQLSCDTETTGLRPYHGDRLFSIVFADETEEYYFNFQDYKDGTPTLSRKLILELQPIFCGARTLFFHNAKFDLHMLWQDGIEVTCDIHDTEVSARLLWNIHMTYSLDDCAQRELGRSKDDLVKKWCDDNTAWKWEVTPGKKARSKNYQFWKVPFDIISKYACLDARLTYDLAIKHIKDMAEIDADLTAKYPLKKSLLSLFEMEKQLTKVCFRMENRGIRIDRKYCEEAIEYETAKYQEAAERFKEETGETFQDSGKKLAVIFEKLGYKIEYTDKGHPQITDEWLSKLNSPIAQCIRTYREHYKRCNTYFRSFIYFADENDIIHPNMRQAGTKTGRFAYNSPNLQNQSSEDDKVKYPVRRAFIPREGCLFVMIDYQQMEFRMMLDYAGELGLIDKINKGHDPHQATADMTALDRRAAKTLNFGILYGMGNLKLANALDITPDKAKEFKQKYFKALDQVDNLIFNVSSITKDRKVIFDWAGRLFQFPDEKFAYKGVNALIQGGAADVNKYAMLALDRVLPELGVDMLLTIHDEAILELPMDSIKYVDLIKNTMENTYPYRYIQLTCSVSHSLKSLGDDIDGLPIDGKRPRDEIQREDNASLESVTQHVGGEGAASWN